MSIEMTIAGKAVNPRDLVVNSGFGDMTGTFNFNSPVTINTGDTVMVSDGASTVMSGVVTSYTKTAGTVSGTFVSTSAMAALKTMYPYTPGSLRTFAHGSGFFLPPDLPEISHADQRIIDEFVIESMARGFAKEQKNREAWDTATDSFSRMVSGRWGVP